MNILTDPLPETVEINGKPCPIEWGFRTGIRFELLVQDEGKPEILKVQEALNLYYPQGVPDIPQAIDRMLWFYRCGKEDAPSRKDGDAGEDEEPLRLDYSYEHDAAYIYAAFQEAYGIDLAAGSLHWWAFRALFQGLPEECAFQKIRGFRSVKVSGRMSKEQKDYYRRMKRIFALPASGAEQAKNDAVTQALLNGGDLTGIL